MSKSFSVKRNMGRPMRKSLVRKQPLSKKQKEQVKDLLEAKLEKKRVYIANTQSVSNAGTIGTMISIAQGLTAITRLGDVINLEKLDLRYSVAAADATNSIRFIILQWKPDNVDDVPAVASILNATSALGTNEPYLQGEPKLKYKILFDRVHHLTLTGPAAEGQRVIIRKKDFLQKMTFALGSATQGKNILYFISISDSAAITHPTVVFDSVLTFTDA